jgi:hypothetical protein
MVNPANRVKDQRASPATVMVNPANRVKDYRASPATVMIQPVSQCTESPARLAKRFPAAGQWHPLPQLPWQAWS